MPVSVLVAASGDDSPVPWIPKAYSAGHAEIETCVDGASVDFSSAWATPVDTDTKATVDAIIVPASRAEHRAISIRITVHFRLTSGALKRTKP
ncbi:hypothetical protein AB0H58_12700 [Nocardia neocaledoniensis]|uniref:hypothetical protein n=1 Tax=Nocardia neocaledoniensis TaxID=236511 RepID=UPI00340CCF81